MGPKTANTASPEGIVATQEMRDIIDWLLQLPEIREEPEEIIVKDAIHIYKKKAQLRWKDQIKALEDAAAKIYRKMGMEEDRIQYLTDLSVGIGRNKMQAMKILLRQHDMEPPNIPSIAFRPEEILNLKDSLKAYVSHAMYDKRKPTKIDEQAYRWLQQYKGPPGKPVPQPISGPMHQPISPKTKYRTPTMPKSMPKENRQVENTIMQPLEMVAWVRGNCRFADASPWLDTTDPVEISTTTGTPAIVIHTKNGSIQVFLTSTQLQDLHEQVNHLAKNEGSQWFGMPISASTKRQVIGQNAGLDAFTMAFIEAALWATTDDKGEPLDKNYGFSDIAPEAMAKIVADCSRFQQENAVDIATWNNPKWPAAQIAGHDFLLTRNHHGSGFWDGDWRADIGNRLTKAAHNYGEFDLYVGDDNRLHS